MRLPQRLVSVLALLPLLGCASYTALAPSDRDLLEREFTARDGSAYLKLSYYVTPFFGDGSKKLLSPVLPEQSRLLESPSGDAISPGAVEKTIPAGRRARVLKVEFPTSWVVTERMVYSPRTQPWVFLALEGERNEVPYILVLRPQLRTPEEVRQELGRYLSSEDLRPQLERFTTPVREAVSRKDVLVDMPTEALEMAWGYPETKILSFEGQVRKELWKWPGGTRTATVVDGRVTEFTGAR
jgi:hypothetical protein